MKFLKIELGQKSISISVKCINCRIKRFLKNYDLQTERFTELVIHSEVPILKRLNSLN